MHHCRKILCLLLAGLFAMQILWMPALAAENGEEPPAIASEEIPAIIEEVLEETVVEEILLEESVPEETLPEPAAEEVTEEVILEEDLELPPEETVSEEEIPLEEPAEEIQEVVSEEIVTEIAEEELEDVPEEEPAPVYDAVPLYYQTDYPDTYYGEGTVATSGCSMTSLAMAATYLTGHEYFPDELARYFAFCGNSNIERLEAGCEALQLPYEKNWDWRTTMQALQEEKIAIVLVNSDSHFTLSQHFIVLTGLTEDGKILVNDPYEPNYTHWALEQGFREGFDESQIVCGFSGAWVFDPAAMPAEPFVYYEAPVEYVQPGQVPLYFQEDYPNTRYAGGTVATSGCSITSLAMVATYMTGHEYLPDELARYFGGRAESHMQRLEIGSDTLQLPYEKNTNWHTTLEALWDGKIAIVLVNDKTYFTQNQHFLVLTGMTSDGKVLAQDSAKVNYSHWALEEGFRNGFDPDAIMKGFEGAWVYDKSAMPEDPVLYYEPKPIRDETRYPEIRLTLEEEDILAKLIWAEARGESPEGQQAVAEVVLNRLVSEDFADSLVEVIYREGQFRGIPYMEDAEPTQAQYDAIEAALYGPNILPMDVYYFATWETNPNVWGQIDHHIFCYAE